MKDPSTVETTSRDDMICPECYTEGLQEHKAFSEDYSGRSEILKATRCPNEECRYHSGFPPEVIEQQYSEASFVQKVTGVFSSGGGGINIGSVVLYSIVFLGLILMGSSALGIDLATVFQQSDEGTFNGYVVDTDGDGLPNASIELAETERTVTTDETGRYSISNVSYGDYTVIANGGNETGSAEQRVRLNQSGVYPLNGTTEATVVSDGQVGLQLPIVSETQETAVLSSTQGITANFISPRNLNNGMRLLIEPIGTEEKNRTLQITNSSQNNITIADGEVTRGQVSVRGDASTESITENYTYRDGPLQFQVYGNQNLESLLLEVPEKASQPTYTREQNVSDGDLISVNISGDETVGPVNVTLSGGQSSSPNQKSGEYSGDQNPTIEIGEESAPSTVEMNVSASLDTSEEVVTGELSGDSFTTDIQGNLPAQNASIIFTGGTPQSETVADQTIDASGETGTTLESRTLVSDASDAEYNLNLEHTVFQNSDYVRAGYNIDGARTEISTGTENVTIDASEGESIAIWIEAQQEPLPSSNYDHSGKLRVASVDIQRTEFPPGEDTGVRATINNPTGNQQTESIPVFKDGEQVQEQRVSVSADSSKTVTFNRVGFSQEGMHSIEVSDADPVAITVGDASLEYGSGEISGELTRLGDSGEVLFDTTGDGSYDCQVSSEGGECEIETIESGTQSLAYEQQGVQDTGYELTYTSRQGARDVTVDIGADGTDEITYDGILRDNTTLQGNATIQEGVNEIDISVGNGGTVSYELVWTESGIVNQPSVSVNGETVISESESFKGERTYQIDPLQSGENTFRFNSGTGQAYIAQIEWTEQSASTTPEIYINSNLACESGTLVENNRCSVDPSIVQPGENEIVFDGGGDEFEYTIIQEARAIPPQVTAEVNGESVTLSRNDGTTLQNDSWRAQTRITTLKSGTNTVTLQSPQVNGVRTSPSGEIQYRYKPNPAQNPTVVVTSQRTQSEYSLEESVDSDGYLRENESVTIPSSSFTAGENTITVNSTNNGSVRVTATLINESINSPIGETQDNSTE